MRKREIRLCIILIFTIVGATLYGMSEIYLDYNRDFEIEIVEKEMLNILNEYRKENSLDELEEASWLDYGAIQRSTEMAKYGDIRFIDANGNEKTHTRPDGSNWSTAFDEIMGTPDNPRFISENIALVMISRKEDEKALAKLLFKTWKDSPPHNEAMLSKDNEAVSFKVAKIPKSTKTLNKIITRDTYIGVQIFDSYEKPLDYYN